MPPLRWGGSGWWLARACSNCLSCSAFVRCCLARSAMLPSCASVSTTPPLVVPASADEVPSMLVAASCASAMLLARQRGEVERSGERRAEGDNTHPTHNNLSEKFGNGPLHEFATLGSDVDRQTEGFTSRTVPRDPEMGIPPSVMTTTQRSSRAVATSTSIGVPASRLHPCWPPLALAEAAEELPARMASASSRATSSSEMISHGMKVHSM